MLAALTDDGTSIVYRTQGSGPRNLVLLHAWGASGGYFDELIEHLDPNAVRSIAIDLRGHGDSGKPDVELSWDRFARDVFSVADHVGIETFVAVGHSMGGKLAQYLPLVQPSRIDGLVLVASPSAAELPTPEFITAWIGLAGDADAMVDTTVRPYLTRPVA